MISDDDQKVARRPRADAERNRLLLLETAKSVFTEKGTGASMDEIARAAGVGPGTLYRHFPNRAALIEAVYRNANAQLAQAADRLVEDRTAVEALREWLLLFVEYLGTKQVMSAALTALPGGTTELYAVSGAQLRATIAMLVENAVQAGEVRLAIEPFELLRAIAAVAADETSARLLVGILVAGMRA